MMKQLTTPYRATALGSLLVFCVACGSGSSTPGETGSKGGTNSSSTSTDTKAAGGSSATTTSATGNGGNTSTSSSASSSGGSSSDPSSTASGGGAVTSGGASSAGGSKATSGTTTATAAGGKTGTAAGGTSATVSTPTNGGRNGGAGGGSPTTPTSGGTSPAAGGRAGGGASNPTAGGAAGTSSASTTPGGQPNGDITGPCDIYASASPAVPCVAAYATTRRLNSKYTGFLYQVRKGGNSLGTGGTTTDIGALADGTADGAAHEAACGTGTCTFSILYDQSGKGNDLKVAPAGCYEGTASEPDYESSATKRSLKVNGHKVYALYMNAHEGYRNNNGKDVPKGSASQGLYVLADGKRIGSACCWDFGNASTNNCNQGTMNAIYFGTGYWGTGTGSGPWFMADLEGGVWAGGTGDSKTKNNNLPSSNIDFAFGILKTSSSNYAIRVGNGQSGSLTTAYDGGLPKQLSHPGGIILGIGGDNSNSSLGTFFEGIMTAGRPTDTTDAEVLANVQAAKYEL